MEVQQAYVTFEMLVECLMEAMAIAERLKTNIPAIGILTCLERCLLTAHQAYAEAYPNDGMDGKIFCEQCHTFLSESSEYAGYCLKCEGRN